MNNKEAIRQLKNIKDDIGSHCNASLWHYEQTLLDIIKMLEDQEQLQWRSVKDDPPKEGGDYLVAIERSILDPKVSVHRYNACGDYWSGAEVGSRIVNITHWMPTPTPPEEVKQDG